jgi:methyl-accepting chemotaxis protein WspA
MELFLKRFSYASKTRFLCGLAFFYSIFLSSEIFYLQHQIKKNFQIKSIGLYLQNEFSQLLQQTLELELLLTENDDASIKDRESDSKEKISNKLREIENFIQTDETKSPLNQSKNIQNDQFLFDKILKQWELISKENKHENLPFTLPDFAQNILDLMEQNMQNHALNLGVELSNFLFSRIVILDIPSVQNTIANISTTFSQIKKENSKTDPHLNNYLNSLHNQLNTIETQLSYIHQENLSDEGKKYIPPMIELFKTYVTNVRNFINEKHHMPTQSTFEALALKTLQEGWEIENKGLNFLKEQVEKDLNILSKRQNISFLLHLFGLLAFLTMYLNRIIRRPLEQLKNAATALAEGDLSVRIPVTSKDEVATIIHAFNHMAEVWETNLLKAKTITSRLVDASKSIFGIVKNLEDNVISQEASVDLMRAKLKEIGSTTQRFKDVLREANKTNLVTSNLAETGRSNLSEMETITHQMEGASTLIVDTLSLIGSQVAKINGVLIRVVSIADQSNLLSLNTAIRANQTGIKGVGFAVVASKIRELADRTAFATLDIESTVKEIVHSVETTMTDVEKFTSQILEQVSGEKQISELLKVRIDQTQQQIKTFESIQNDMDIQFNETLQINSLINDLVQVTTETAKSARKLKQDAEFLSQGTERLEEVINRFHFHS